SSGPVTPRNSNPALIGLGGARLPVRSGTPLNTSSGLVKTPATGSGPATSPQPVASSPTPVRLLGTPSAAGSQTSAIIPPGSTPLVNQPATQATGGLTSGQTVRTIQAPRSSDSGPATRTIPGLGAAIASQNASAPQPSSTPMSAPVTRVIPPAPSTASTQNIRAIPAFGTAPANQTIGGTQSSSAPASVPVTRAVQP